MVLALTATRAIMARNMAGWERVWSDEQKEAVALAYEDLKIRPYTRVAELAKAGKLEYDGKPLEPFDMPLATIRGETQRLRKMRAGQVSSQLATMPAADAIEDLRRRLINAADAMMRIQERKPVRQRDPEQLRQIARCVREAAAIPQAARVARKPGDRDDEGKMVDGQTNGGLASQIMARHKARPAATHHVEQNEDGDSARSAFRRTDGTTDGQQPEPSTTGTTTVPVPGDGAAEAASLIPA